MGSIYLIWFLLSTLRKAVSWEFPSGPVVKSLHLGNAGSIPGQGTKIPHAAKKKEGCELLQVMAIPSSSLPQCPLHC